MQRFNEVLQELLVFELTLLYILIYQLVTGVILPKTLCKNKGEWLKLRGLHLISWDWRGFQHIVRASFNAHALK